MLNKKAQASRTVILISIIIFYIALFVFYQYYGEFVYRYSITDAPGYTYDNSSIVSNSNGGLDQYGIYFVTGFTNLPWLLNLMLFTPILGLLTYLIIVAFIPTINSGQ